MTEAQKAKISRGIRKSLMRKRLSASMKESWARRRQEQAEVAAGFAPIPEEQPESVLAIAPSEPPTVYELFEAAVKLGMDGEEFKAEVCEHFAAGVIVHALSDERFFGTNLQSKLRGMLIHRIRQQINGADESQ